MAVRLFVGNLPYNATEADLREHFSAVGTVAGIWIATDRETGRPRGFAFVEFDDRAVAEEAVRRFNNQSFGGRMLAVNEARPQERGGGGGGAPPPRRPGPPPGAPRYGGPGGPGSGPPPPRSDGPGGDRPRPPFRPQTPPDSGFFPESSEPPRRTRTPPPKKKEPERKRPEFDKTRPPKQRPIQVASGGRFFSSDDFDDEDMETGELDETFFDDEELGEDVDEQDGEENDADDADEEKGADEDADADADANADANADADADEKHP